MHQIACDLQPLLLPGALPRLRELQLGVVPHAVVGGGGRGMQPTVAS